MIVIACLILSPFCKLFSLFCVGINAEYDLEPGETLFSGIADALLSVLSLVVGRDRYAPSRVGIYFSPPPLPP